MTARSLRVAHLATVDMSLELLLGPQLDAVIDAGGDVIGISAPGAYVPDLRRRGVQHIGLESSTRGWSLRADLAAAGQLWRVLRREQPTILHTHNPKPGAYGRVIGRLTGVPIIVNTVHGLYATPDDGWLKRLAVYAVEAFASRWSNAELVQNVEDVDIIRRLRLAARHKVVHLGNGVDLDRFRPEVIGREERRRVRAGWGAKDDTVVVGSVGRLVAEKGYPELFQAVAGMGSRVRLVVIGGDDPHKSDALGVDALRRADGAGVIRLGHRNDVDRLLGALDVFVLASHREGQPRAAMEAAATGLPIIATDIRGCRQVVDHGVTGLLVPSRDVAALRAAIERLAADQTTRVAMGASGRRKAEREFDERAVVRRVMTCYARVAARRGITLVPVHRPQ